MAIKTITVYVVVKEDPLPRFYKDRFMPKVFLRKDDAVKVLREDPQSLLGYGWLGYGCKIINCEVHGDRYTITKRTGDGHEETQTFAIEKLKVGEDRVFFDSNGVAEVSNWEYVLVKNLGCVDWDTHEWVHHLAELGYSECYGKYVLDCCDWWKFIGVTDVDMPKLCSCPWFLDHKECAGIQLRSDDWCQILKSHPEFETHPRFASSGGWEMFTGQDWSELLSAQPRFADHCQWDELSGWNWMTLLLEKDIFLERFRPVAEVKLHDGSITSYHIPDFIIKFPEFGRMFDLTCLRACDWVRLLSVHPEYEPGCDFSNFCDEDWVVLLQAQPQFLNRVNWNVNWRSRSGNADNNLIRLFRVCPNAIHACDLSQVGGTTIVETLVEFPELEPRCPWERLSCENWAWLLREQPKYGESCMRWAEFSMRHLISIFEKHPELSVLLDWKLLDPASVVDLLVKFPEFVKHVELSTVTDPIDCIRLYLAQPRFGEQLQVEDAWTQLHGYVWEGKCGPIVAVPWHGRDTEVPFPFVHRLRLRESRKSDIGSSSWVEGELHQVTNYRAIVMDGVEVDNSEREYVRCVREWFRTHETSVRIIYFVDRDGGFNHIEDAFK